MTLSRFLALALMLPEWINFVSMGLMSEVVAISIPKYTHNYGVVY
jgi:hypothetical protein